MSKPQHDLAFQVELERAAHDDASKGTVGEIREDGVLVVRAVVFSDAPVAQWVKGEMVDLSVSFDEKTIRAINKRGKGVRSALLDHGMTGDWMSSRSSVDHVIGKMQGFQMERRGQTNVVTAEFQFDPELAIDNRNRSLIGPIHRGIVTALSAGFSLVKGSLVLTAEASGSKRAQYTAKLEDIGEGSVVGLQADPNSGFNRNKEEGMPPELRTDSDPKADEAALQRMVDARVTQVLATREAAEAEKRAAVENAKRSERYIEMLAEASATYGLERALKMKAEAKGDPDELAVLIRMAEADTKGEADERGEKPVPTPTRRDIAGGEELYRGAIDDMKISMLARGLPNNWDNQYRAQAAEKKIDLALPSIYYLARAAEGAGLPVTRAIASVAAREQLVSQLRHHMRGGPRALELMRSGAAAGSLVPSDLDAAYQDVTRLALEMGYERAAIPEQLMGQRVMLDDFRPKTFVQIDLAADWQKVPTSGELSEFRHITDSYFLQADRYGGIARIDDIAIANDDLGIIVGVPARVGEYVAGEESRIVVDTTLAGFNGSWDADHDIAVASPLDFGAHLDTMRRKALSLPVVADVNSQLASGERLSTSAALIPTWIMYGPGARKAWIEYATPVTAAQGAGLDARTQVVRGEYERTLYANGFEAVQQDVNSTTTIYGPGGTQEGRLWGRVTGRERRVDVVESPADRVPGILLRFVSTFAFKVAKNTLFRIRQTA